MFSGNMKRAFAALALGGAALALPAAAMAGVVWAMQNPARDVIEPMVAKVRHVQVTE